MSAPHTDPLVELWRQYEENEASSAAVEKLTDAAEIRSAWDRYSDRWDELAAAITATPAQSIAGLRVQFLMLLHDLRTGESAYREPLIAAITAGFDRLTSIDRDLARLR